MAVTAPTTKMAVQLSANTSVLNESLVLRMNICGKKPAHRKSAKRYHPISSMFLKT